MYMQVAYLGLVNAINRFDPERGDFFVYAYPMVLGEARRYFRERTILLLRFFGNKTQSQIAQELGISQMHVSRLLAGTLRLLRERMYEADPAGPSGA